MSREAISDMLVAIIGKKGKVPECWRRAGVLYNFKKGDGKGGASEHSLPVKKKMLEQKNSYLQEGNE